MKAFIHEARARNICIAVNEKVPHSASSDHFDMIFAHLLQKPNARAVVLFVRMEDARGILLAAQRADNINYFTWVASDGWGKEEKLVEGVEDVAEGAITVELQTTIIKEFDTYMKNLNPDNNKRNPWFNEVSCPICPTFVFLFLEFCRLLLSSRLKSKKMLHVTREY